MNRTNWVITITVLVLMILCFMFPFILTEYQSRFMLTMLINILLVASFRLIALTGLFSFAHISFMGLGGYGTGLLALKLGLPFGLTLPLTILGVGITSLLFGSVLLRTRGFQFFVASLAAGEAIRWSWILFENPFGSYAGIAGIPRPESILGIDFNVYDSYYYLTLVIVLVSMAIMYQLEHSRIGRTANVLALDENLAESVGINTFRYKLMFFVIGSTFAALAGILLSHYTRTASPGDYTLTYSMNILIYFIVGGAGNFIGPIVGAAALGILADLSRNLAEYVPLMLGGILIAAVLLLPGGIVSLPTRVSTLLRRHMTRLKSSQ